jgi:hypothetical protein
VTVVEKGNVFEDDVLRALRGDGDGSFAEVLGGPYAVRHFEPPPNPTPDFPFTTPRELSRVVPADVDRDGDADVIAGVPGLPELFEILRNDGSGRLAPATEAVRWSSTASNVIDVGTADVDLDGDVDLVVFDVFGGSVIVLDGDGSGHFNYDGRSRAIVSEGEDTSLSLADVNGDAFVDVIAARTYPEREPRIGVLIGGGESFRPDPGGPYHILGSGTFSGPTRFGDFDGDDRADVLTAIQGIQDDAAATPHFSLAVLLSHSRVRKARPEARASARVVPFGSPVRIAGTGRCDAPAAALRLYRRVVTPQRLGDWYARPSRRREREGDARANDRPPVNVQYQWRQKGRRSNVVTVRVTPEINAQWTAQRTSSTVSGQVRPAHPGYRVRLQRETGGRWKTVATGRLDSRSRFAIARPLRNRYDEYRVTLAADAHHAESHRYSLYPPFVASRAST